MMRFFWMLVVVVGAFAIDTAFDDYDVDSYVADATNVRGLAYCSLEEGPCDPFAKHLRDNLLEVVQTACATCNPKQAEQYRKATVAIKKLYPEELKRMEDKYDPESKYRTAYYSFVRGSH